MIARGLGWSYPAGYSGPPDPELICQVCRGNPEGDSCLCEECPVCGSAGDPGCYLILAADGFGHGMFLDHHQRDQLQERLVEDQAQQTEQALADLAWAEWEAAVREDPPPCRYA